MNDILVDISNEDLPRLAALYEKHVHWAPHVFAFIKLGIKWKKSQKYQDKIKFTSPNHSWEKDGTIIVLMTMHCNDVFVFTLEESCANLLKGLQETTRIDLTKRVLFFCVHEKHIPSVNSFLESIGDNEAIQSNCTAYAIPPEEAKDFTYHIPPEVYVGELDPSLHATQVNSVWPHRYPGSEKYIQALIEINGGVGLFLKENNQLVSWIIKHILGHLGLLQTDENYKRRGYGSVMGLVLSKRIGEDGFWPFGPVLVGNRASETLFEKFNFRKLGLCAYIVRNDAGRIE